MSIKCQWLSNNQTTEYTVTLLKPLYACSLEDFNRNAFAASYDQINNVMYVGQTPQCATDDRSDTVWYSAGDSSIDFSDLCFCSKNDTKIYRRTIVIAVPQNTQITEFTSETVPVDAYLVADIDSLNKVVLVNSVSYHTDYLRTVLDFSTPLRHCLSGTVFNYADAADTLTDGNTVYQLYPVYMYSADGYAFFTQKEPYTAPYISTDNNVCGFKYGITSFWEDSIKLCLGINPNTAEQSTCIKTVYSKNIIDSVYGDMLNIYDCPSPVNADIKLSIYSEQDSPDEMYLQRGVRLDIDCYTACASQFGFIFVNDITNEVYEPAMRDGIVEGYKELVYKPVKFRLLTNNNSNNQLRTVPPVADVQISNEQEYYTVGVSVIGRWQVRKYSVNDLEHPVLVEDFGAKDDILDAYLEADGDFDYFAGDEHLSLVTSGTPWLIVIRAADKHMYVKKVGADVSTAVLLDTNVEQASVCRGWKSDKYDVDAGVIVAYRKAVGVYMRAYYKINDVYTWDSVQILSGFKADKVEVKRLNDFRIGIYSYSQSNQNQVWLSPRYYIGGTSKSEYVSLQFTNDFTVLGCAKATEVRDFKVIATTLVAPDTIRVQGNFPFYRNDSTWSDITLTTGLIDNGLSNYYIENGYLFLKLRNRLTTAVAPLTFKIRAINRIQYECTPSCRPVVPEMTFEFKSDTLPTEHVAISAAFNLHPITTTQMKHLRVESEEHVNLNTQFALHPITITPINYMKEVNTEQVSLAVGMSLHPITVTQSGDTPI